MRNHTARSARVRPSSVRLGPVALNVADLEAMRAFYSGPVGLDVIEDAPGRAVLGSDGVPMVELREAPGAAARPPGTSGLFHLAVLEPSREALAGTLRRLLETQAPLAGASDHLVSEALYLDDPEGNGIEIYRDRPVSEWSWNAGQVEMATLPLDLASLLAEAGNAAGEGAGRRLGHVHMNVADLKTARGFYDSVIGLDVTSDSYPGALFVSADGYHHHIGLNVWQGVGAPPPPAGSLGLAGLTVRVAGGEQVDAIAARAQTAGLEIARDGGDLLVTDPFGVPLRIVAG